MCTNIAKTTSAVQYTRILILHSEIKTFFHWKHFADVQSLNIVHTHTDGQAWTCGNNAIQTFVISWGKLGGGGGSCICVCEG